MGQVKFRELIRLLEDDGWRPVAQRGSHRQYEHPRKPGRVTVAGKPRSRCAEGYGGEYPSAGRATEDESLSEYLVVIEHEGESWGAYCPDLPGVGVVGDSREEIEQLIRDAITLHLDGLRQAGEPIPEPTAVGTTLVEVPAA
jgi:predicted RNA binding protein YcfA (HicA-like mRNA interferase family)/predicted RNase H-like HicB family nuclease